MSDKRERRMRWQACARKNAYDKEQAGIIAARNRLNAYKCMFCEFWHVSSTPERLASNDLHKQWARDAKFANRRKRAG